MTAKDFEEELRAYTNGGPFISTLKIAKCLHIRHEHAAKIVENLDKYSFEGNRASKYAIRDVAKEIMKRKI